MTLLSELTVTLVANAGVLLNFHGTRFLVDSVFYDDRFHFSSPSPDVWRQMLEGRGIFADVDHVLVTHTHADHVSPKLMRRYLEARPVKSVMLPAPETPAEWELARCMEQTGVPFCPLEPGRTCQRRLGEVCVSAFPTRHLDRQFWDVPHFCYLLSSGGEHVLITADADYTAEDFSCLRDVPLRAVLLNPLFFHALRDGRHFRGKLTAGCFCVYHVPFSGGGYGELQSMAERDAARWPEREGRAVLLREPLQTVEIPNSDLGRPSRLIRPV